MMFSTKAEYGVRVMAHLAAREGEGPVALATIADAEGLSLAYLEHLARRLREAQLVQSTRGARGGYTLARPASSISMAEVVEALEGRIAPIECITAEPDGGGELVCAREAATDRSCPTKLLWTRVQGAIVGTLEEIALSELARPASHRTRETRKTAA